jgi:hypothetical protein
MGFVVTIRRSGASSSPNAPIVTHRMNRNLTSKISDLEEDSTQDATMRVSPWRPLFGLIDSCLHANRIDLDVGGRTVRAGTGECARSAHDFRRLAVQTRPQYRGMVRD